VLEARLVTPCRCCGVVSAAWRSATTAKVELASLLHGDTSGDGRRLSYCVVVLPSNVLQTEY